MQADLPAVRQVLVGYPFPMADTGDVCNFPARVRGRGGAARAGGVESQAVKVSRGQARKVRVCLPSLFYFIDLLYNKIEL